MTYDLHILATHIMLHKNANLKHIQAYLTFKCWKKNSGMMNLISISPVRPLSKAFITNQTDEDQTQ